MALMMGASSISLAATANAAEAAPAAPAATAPAFSFCEWAPKALTLFNAERDNAENPWIQDFSVKLRAQYQMSSLDPNGGAHRVKGGDKGKDARFNDEWRRFRLGAQAKVLNHFTLYANWNIGDLDARRKYNKETNNWQHSDMNEVLDELYLRGTFKPVTFTLGKHKPAFIGEYRTSSSKIITIERSALVNQLTPEKLYGVSIKNADKKADFGWELGTWLNGARDNQWAEPSFHTDTNVMVGGSLNYATGKKSRIYLDYMHSFYDGDGTREGVSYDGPAAEDIVALTWEAQKDKLSFMAEAIAAFNVYDMDDAENVYGLVLMPSYRFTPHVEGVFRYQLSSGSNAVSLDSRYYTTNGNFSSTCDLMHGFYAGVNYYVCPKNPDTMRIMAGVEYINSHGEGTNGDKGFSGWNYSAAVRCNF